MHLKRKSFAKYMKLEELFTLHNFTSNALDLYTCKSSKGANYVISMTNCYSCRSFRSLYKLKASEQQLVSFFLPLQSLKEIKQECSNSDNAVIFSVINNFFSIANLYERTLNAVSFASPRKRPGFKCRIDVYKCSRLSGCWHPSKDTYVSWSRG